MAQAQKRIIFAGSGNIGITGLKLDPGVYRFNRNEKDYFITRVFDEFKTVDLTGSRGEHICNMVFDHFKTVDDKLGVALSGKKGTGKTAIAETIGNRVIKELKMPVFLIDGILPVDVLAKFCRMGNAMFFFDEFENNYTNSVHASATGSRPNQNQFLTILSDRNIEKSLFIFADNAKWDKADAMMQRPDRIFYHFEFNAPSGTEFLEFAKDADIGDEVKTYMKGVFDISENHGYDSFNAVIRSLNGIQTLNNAMDIIKDINIPRGYRRTLVVTNVINKETRIPVNPGWREGTVSYLPEDKDYVLSHPINPLEGPDSKHVEIRFNYNELKSKYSPDSYEAHCIKIETEKFEYILSLMLSQPRESDKITTESLAARKLTDYVIYRWENAMDVKNSGKMWF